MWKGDLFLCTYSLILKLMQAFEMDCSYFPEQSTELMFYALKLFRSITHDTILSGRHPMVPN